MPSGTVMLTIAALVLIGAFPAWPCRHARDRRPKQRAETDIDRYARVDAAAAAMTRSRLRSRRYAGSSG